MKHFTHCMVVAGMIALATPVAAQQMATQLLPRTTVVSQAKAAAAGSFVKNAAPAPQKAISINPSDYGEVVSIISEDFSKMTTGSEAEPDEDTDISYQNDDNAWINMSGDYTKEFGWGSHGAYPAGGCLYINSGQVNTPLLDLTGNDGIFFVKFRARTFEEDAESNYTVIEGAETNGMTATWRFLENYQVEKIDNTWREYEFMFHDGGPTTLINICPQDAAILIDDIEVYQVKQYVGTPAGHKHRFYTGKTFNLSWDAVDGADSYLLNVYTVKGDGVTPLDYIVENKKVTGTEFVVDNADSGDTYYYTVQGVKGDKVSMPSTPVKIMDVEAPTLADECPTNGDTYTASWNEVPTAERYNYVAAAKNVAKQDGKTTVTHLWMPGSTYGEGSELAVEYSKDNPDDRSVDRGYPQMNGQAGWRATHYAVYKDALVLDAFWMTQAKEDDGLISPEFDLSKDGGKINIEMTVAAEPCEYYDENGTAQTAYTRCAVALFSYDKSVDDFVQTELVYVQDLSNDWQTKTVELTKGTDRSIIGFYGTYTWTNLYIKELKITQNYKAGEFFYDPFYYGNFLEGTSVDVNVPYRLKGADIYHRAQSVRVKQAAQSQFERTSYLESKMSDYKLVMAEARPTGINNADVKFSGATVRMEGDRLVVNNPAKAPVYVYTAAGAVVASDMSGAETASFSVPANATYIVKVGKQSVKVTL